MVLPVQFLTKSIIAITITIVGSWLAFYREERLTEGYFAIPLVYVAIDEQDIATTGGVAYYNGMPYTGWFYSLYPNGDTVYKKGYNKGRQEGRAIKWYSNGLLAEIRWYHNGRKQGFHEGWHENGMKKFEASMHNDHYEGNVKEWLETGMLFRDFNYVNGNEDGMQRMYWGDGSIRANYKVVKGRKYGLTGVTNCVSVWNDSSSF